MKQATVVFLLDAVPATEIVLLKRAADKDFAPNLYTGIGGRIEVGEEPETAAYRELQEETGLVGIQLTEFARGILTYPPYRLHYYWGIFSEAVLPACNEGDLEWVAKESLLDKEIIPSTREIIKEWQKREFSLDSPFSMVMSGRLEDGVTRHILISEVKEGLA